MDKHFCRRVQRWRARLQCADMRRNRVFGGIPLIRTWTVTSGLSALVLAAMAAAVHSEPAAAPAANVTAQRLLHADSEPSQWLTYGGDYNEQRYSSFTRATAQNRNNPGA